VVAKAKPSKLPSLLPVIGFLKPYKLRLAGASLALLFTAAATLSIGWGLQVLIDRGFGKGDSADLLVAVSLLIAIAAAIAVGTFVRFYLVSWLGERVSADLRKAVFDNIVRLHPGFFELNRSGEIMSRLTTDTTLLQTIIGSSFSMALRSSLTMVGALVLMFITNLKLSLIIAVGVPLILLPLLFFGRRVRRLSNQSQDSIASVGSYAGEVIQHIRVVQSYTQERFESAAFAREVERAFAIARRRIWQRALLMGGAILLVFAGMAGMLWEGRRTGRVRVLRDHGGQRCSHGIRGVGGAAAGRRRRRAPDRAAQHPQPDRRPRSAESSRRAPAAGAETGSCDLLLSHPARPGRTAGLFSPHRGGQEPCPGGAVRGRQVHRI